MSSCWHLSRLQPQKPPREAVALHSSSNRAWAGRDVTTAGVAGLDVCVSVLIYFSLVQFKKSLVSPDHRPAPTFCRCRTDSRASVCLEASSWCSEGERERERRKKAAEKCTKNTLFHICQFSYKCHSGPSIIEDVDNDLMFPSTLKCSKPQMQFWVKRRVACYLLEVQMTQCLHAELVVATGYHANQNNTYFIITTDVR